MNMSDLLNKAGFETADDPTLIDFTSIKDVCLPFGFWIVPNDFEATKWLDGINYVRRNSTPFNFDDYKTSKDTEITRCLKANQSICRILPDRFSGIEMYSDYLNCDNPNGDHEWKDPMAYGYSCVMFYFQYDTQFETWEFVFSSSNHWYNNGSGKFVPLNLKPLISKECIRYDDDYLLQLSEFVPIVISKNDGCIISHKKYKDRFGLVHDAVTSPCFGKNIKKHPNIMERLSNWISDGGFIKDDNMYLICKERDTDNLYLRRYVKE